MSHSRTAWPASWPLLLLLGASLLISTIAQAHGEVANLTAAERLRGMELAKFESVLPTLEEETVEHTGRRLISYTCQIFSTNKYSNIVTCGVSSGWTSQPFSACCDKKYNILDYTTDIDCLDVLLKPTPDCSIYSLYYTSPSCCSANTAPAPTYRAPASQVPTPTSSNIIHSFPPPAPQVSPPASKGGVSVGIVVGAIVGGVLVVLIVVAGIVACLWFARKKGETGGQLPSPEAKPPHNNVPYFPTHAVAVPVGHYPEHGPPATPSKPYEYTTGVSQFAGVPVVQAKPYVPS